MRDSPVPSRHAEVPVPHYDTLLVAQGDQACWSLDLRCTQLNFRLRISDSVQPESNLVHECPKAALQL